MATVLGNVVMGMEKCGKMCENVLETRFLYTTDTDTQYFTDTDTPILEIGRYLTDTDTPILLIL